LTRTSVVAPDFLRRSEVAAIRDLEIAARALVAGLRHGRHAAPLLGAGPEIWGVRPYRQGDDATQVDWKRSARGDRLYSRERVDTSQTQALVVVDVSRSMGVGHTEGRPTKLEVTKVIAAGLITLLIEQGDTVGLFAATLPVPAWQPPAGGAHHRQVLLDRLTTFDAAGDVAPSAAVAQATTRLRRPSLLVVISDAWDDTDYLETLRRSAASGHDVVAVTVVAPGDRTLPEAGVVELEDAETGAVIAVDAAALAADYQAAAAAHRQALSDGLRGSRLAGTDLDIEAPLVPQLRRFLAARHDRSGW
jgi:uncharacterized protein (DUF58 family)